MANAAGTLPAFPVELVARAPTESSSALLPEQPAAEPSHAPPASSAAPQVHNLAAGRAVKPAVEIRLATPAEPAAATAPAVK